MLAILVFNPYYVLLIELRLVFSFVDVYEKHYPSHLLEILQKNYQINWDFEAWTTTTLHTTYVNCYRTFVFPLSLKQRVSTTHSSVSSPLSVINEPDQYLQFSHPFSREDASFLQSI